MLYTNRLIGGGAGGGGFYVVIGLGQSLMTGHFSNQSGSGGPGGSAGGKRKFLQVMRTHMPRRNILFIDGSNGGSYAAKTSADADVRDSGDEPYHDGEVIPSGSVTNPFTTTASSAVVTVAHTAHGRRVNSKAQFSGAAAVGGITVNGAYNVTSVINSNTYTITHGSAASGNDGPGGGTVDYAYSNTEFWWDNIGNAPGPLLLDAIDIIDALKLNPDAYLWAQGEADTFFVPAYTSIAEDKESVQAIADYLRAAYNPNALWGIQGSPGRRGEAYNNTPAVQLIREGYWDLIDTNAWMFKAGESYPEDLTDQVHLVAQGYVNTSERNAYALLRAEGLIASGGIGPVYDSVNKSGSDFIFTFTHDAGTDFDASDYTPGANLKSFLTVREGFGEHDISSVTKTDTNEITVTVSSPPGYFDMTVYGGYDSMYPLDTDSVPYDNATVAMPIRPFMDTIAGAGGFDPTEISDLECWFDGADVATITKDGSDKVSQWDDKSGNGNDATASAGHEPTWQNNAINGEDALYSAGGTSLGMSFAHTITNTDPFTIIAVVKADTGSVDPTTSSSVNVSVALSSVTTTSACYAALRQGMNTGTHQPTGTATGFVAGVGSTLGTGGYTTQKVYTLWYDTTSGALYFDGTLDAALTPGAGPFTVNATGSLFNEAPIISSRAYIGWICEVAIYKRALSDIERGLVEYYMAQKWGIV